MFMRNSSYQYTPSPYRKQPRPAFARHPSLRTVDFSLSYSVIGDRAQLTHLRLRLPPSGCSISRFSWGSNNDSNQHARTRTRKMDASPSYLRPAAVLAGSLGVVSVIPCRACTRNCSELRENAYCSYWYESPVCTQQCSRTEKRTAATPEPSETSYTTYGEHVTKPRTTVIVKCVRDDR